MLNKSRMLRAGGSGSRHLFDHPDHCCIKIDHPVSAHLASGRHDDKRRQVLPRLRCVAYQVSVQEAAEALRAAIPFVVRYNPLLVFSIEKHGVDHSLRCHSKQIGVYEPCIEGRDAAVEIDGHPGACNIPAQL